MAALIDDMKKQLLAQLDEWLGFDVPEVGSEDYETWQSRLMDIEDIKTFSDVYEYLNCDEDSANEFFESFGVKNFKLKI